ncbi:hypothetical protein ACRARG_20255 [Pseudooceanicola sp. C21-150M6]|uniref:hypothetical protein n=1 Tax=Pseudooceanicola sp. C21-150M6 TaxID=3434355 RepID=UPI003D7F2F07
MPRTSDTTGNGEEIIPADRALSLLLGNAIEMQEIAVGLENTYTRNLPERGELSSEAIQTIQRLDYLTQSLTDLCAIIEMMAPRLGWNPQAEPNYNAFASSVRLESSLQKLSPSASQKSDISEDQIWFNPEQM